MKNIKISNNHKVFSLSTLLTITVWLMTFMSTVALGQTSANNSPSQTENQKGCNLTLDQVQNKNYSLSNGSKQIVTYSVGGFDDKENCWLELEAVGKRISEDSEIAGVYFFTLPPAEIREINAQYDNFEQYNADLIAVFWKDPDSGPTLKRYPNTTLDGE